jgi:hypothetical protein
MSDPMISGVRGRRICGAVLLWVTMVLGIAVARGGGVSTPPTGVLPITAAADCVLGLFCTPTPGVPTPPHSATPKPPTGRATPTATGPSTAPPSFVVPLPPTVPADTASASAPPAVSGLQVEAVSLVVTSGDTARTGVTVLVQATCTAHRGADVYSVAHVKVAFQVAGPPGSSPAVTPPEADSGDTGIATVSVAVGGVPGDIQLTATSGGITGTATIHVTADQSTPTPIATPASTAALPGSVRIVDSGGTTGGRAVAVAGLVGLGAAILATALLRIGLLPRLAARRPRSTPVPAENEGGETGQQPV